MLSFPFDSEKTAQAAFRILNRHPAPLTFGEVVKLLYFADRGALIERGRPVTGDRMLSMDHGPVLSRTYDLVKDEDPDPEATRFWHEYVGPREAGHVIRPSRDDDPALYGCLTEWELALIDGVTQQLGHKGFSGLRELGHSLPEWTDPEGTSKPIDPTIILRDAGWDEEAILDADKDARATSVLAEIFR